MTAGAPLLTLAELERHDPGAPGAGLRERRFLCPLPACADHQNPARHRSLSVDMDTGKWHCHRCKAGGLLRERWPERPRMSRGERGRRYLSEVCGLARQADTPAPDPKDGPADAWRDHLEGRLPIAGTPAETYLCERRGIPAELARQTAQYHPAFRPWKDTPNIPNKHRAPDRPAVLFPIRDLEGRLVAAQGRYMDRREPKTMTTGHAKAGLFATPGALEADPVIITEAPIDALSLAAVGYPAVALCGTALREWLAQPLAMRRVLLAFDADAAGDKAASEWTAALRFGTRCARLRPNGAKDWNELLQAVGAEALRARLRELLTPDAGAQACDGEDPFASDDADTPEGTDTTCDALRPVGRAPDANTGHSSAASELLAPFAALIERAEAGTLPPGPVELRGTRVIDPARYVLSAAREIRDHADAPGELWRHLIPERVEGLRRLAEWAEGRL